MLIILFRYNGMLNERKNMEFAMSGRSESGRNAAKCLVYSYKNIHNVSQVSPLCLLLGVASVPRVRQ